MFFFYRNKLDKEKWKIQIVDESSIKSKIFFRLFNLFWIYNDDFVSC